MWLKWRRTPPTYADPQPKQVTITADEVATLLALVGVMADHFPINDDDSDVMEVIAKARQARQWVHNGHKVSIFIPMGDGKQL